MNGTIINARKPVPSGAAGDDAPSRTKIESLTDAGNGARFVNRHGKDVRYVPEWGWMAWDGSRWTRDELRVRALMLETARGIYTEAASTDDKALQKALSEWARKSQQAQRIQGALWCAQPSVAARTDDFDREPWLLPCANGTVDLRTGEVHPHNREHMLTRRSPAVYDGNASCPTWTAFLERVLPKPELRAFVQRAAGYSLTGLTAAQVLFFLYGQGRNGKTVFIEALGDLVGEFHEPTRIDTLSESRGGIPNDVAALAGARVVTVSETPEGARLNESLVKDLTGGDTISARFLRHEFFAFRPQFKLWVRGNHKPVIRGTDDGIWRRLMLVPFTVQIPESEVDPTLPQRIRDEFPGILAWAVQGCLEWQKHGLKPPACVTEAVKEYRTEMDVMGEFLADCCVMTPRAETPATPLFKAYQNWCEKTGERAISQRRFGSALSERGLRREKGGPENIYHWYGIRLKAGIPDQPDHSDLVSSSTDLRARSQGYTEIRSGRSGTSENRTAPGLADTPRDMEPDKGSGKWEEF